MNHARLQHLKEILKAVPKKNFDLRTWAGTPSSSLEEDAKLIKRGATPVTCGTTACALGWAATDKEFKKAGLHLVKGCCDIITPTFKDDEGLGAGVSFFDISYGKASYLFDPNFYSKEKPTTKDVIKRIDELLADGAST